MKFGIALGVELLREYSSQMNFKGNILFLAVPAEETNSEGMIGSISHIIELQKKYDLNYRGFLLPEPYINKFPEDKKRYIHVGSCGKIMPLFLFAGKETHVSSPFSGFNPNLLASELGRLLENNSDFCSIDKNISTPPPSCLKQTDLKELYSVQTPIFAASYFNLITLNLNPEELMDKLISLSNKAFDNAIEVFYRNKSVYEALSGSKKLDTHIKPKVITYAELRRRVKDIHGESFEYNMSQLIDRWKSSGMDIQTISINIMKETCERYPEKEPMIIIGFAPPYYPDRYPDISTQNGKSFMEVLDSIIEYARDKHNDIMVKDDYYMGICDLSYTGFNEKLDINKISNNLVGLNQTYMFPADKLKMLDIPGIVLGVYGKDLHKYTERLHLPYSLDILPDIYDFAIKELLT
jgi:arginine utilization protein RocB